MNLPIQFDVEEEYENAFNKEADKESRLISINRLKGSHISWNYPLDDLVLDDTEDIDIRIAALDCLGLYKPALYDIDINKIPKKLALAVIERLDSGDELKEIALNHQIQIIVLKH